MSYSNQLLRDNYVIIPNFISSERARNLSKEFKDYAESNNLPDDGQVTLSKVKYDYISFLELLCEKTPEISNIIGETVLPTYTYARVYYKGAVLEKHTDRDACEVSLTVNLDGDYPWPIWIETPEKEKRFVSLNPGDALLYLGCIAPHWRYAYEGNWYTQVFLHYVRSRGDKSYAYFDKKRNSLDNNQNEYHNNIINTESLSQENQPEEIKSDCNPEPQLNVEVPKSPEIYIPRLTSKLEDFIKVFNNIIPDELCDRILKEYNSTSEWDDTRIGSGTVEKTLRSCEFIGISQQNVIEKNSEIRLNLDRELLECTRKVTQKYKEIFDTFDISIDTGYEILKYEVGDFYIQHTDSFTELQRTLTCSIALNDDYGGGEFALFNREMVIKPVKGSAIVFPSNFMYPHEIMPVTEGTRYSIITWFV